jgi:hypothetical protein
MSERTISFVRSIAARFPRLAPLLEEHIEDNSSEVLPHLFFGDLTRYVLSLLAAATGENEFAPRLELRKILEFLEETYASNDQELQELISASFLENLPRPGEEGWQIREMVGPRLSTQLRAIG